MVKSFKKRIVLT